MSIRSIIVLALVAVVTVQANSFPFNVKGGQSYYQEPLKGHQQVQWQQRQPLYQQTVQQHQQVEPSVQAPVQAPVQASVQAPAYETPVKGGQSFYQESVKGQYAQQPLKSAQPMLSQHQQVEQAPLQQAPLQAPVQAQVQTPAYETPVKGGQNFYQEPVKGQFAQQPLRQPLQQFVQQTSHQQVEQAPLQAQSFETPVKGGQSFYQEPYKGQFTQAPLRQPLVQQVANQQSQHVDVAAPKGQSYFGLPTSPKL